ncbi:MAG TPA: hypothetical protein VNK70_02855 [Candidatus Paceibacterota bacterium]|nr:hypothetical protein [Candidatus Paceibacterota bacterium]
MTEKGFEIMEGGAEEINLSERNNAQLQLMELMGASDTEARIRWIDENSDAFRELLRDRDFLGFIRSGDFENAREMLENFKTERQGKQ